MRGKKGAYWIFIIQVGPEGNQVAMEKWQRSKKGVCGTWWSIFVAYPLIFNKRKEYIFKQHIYFKHLLMNMLQEEVFPHYSSSTTAANGRASH